MCIDPEAADMTRFILVSEEGAEGSRFQYGAVCPEKELALFTGYQDILMG